MAHCPPELLEDLADLFAELRTWPGVLEKSRGVFYLRRLPFLHFHRSADGRRRADIKSATGWVAFDLPHPLARRRRREFVAALRRHYPGSKPLSTRVVRTRSEKTGALSRGSARGGSRRRGS